MTNRNLSPLVGVVMGSQSDWDTMQHACRTLYELDVPYQAEIISAHRTPDLMLEYAEQAENKGLRVIIAGAGGAAHLPGMLASKTLLPVLGVPVQSKALSGQDSLYSIVQMPPGIAVGTLAIGKSGAINAALLAGSIVGNEFEHVKKALKDYRQKQTNQVLNNRTVDESAYRSD